MVSWLSQVTCYGAAPFLVQYSPYYCKKFFQRVVKNVSAIESNALSLIAQDISTQHGIPLEAAEDVIDRVQELLYLHRSGGILYESEQDILRDFGIPVSLLWAFD